jgi:hypothetical protein
MGLEKKTLTWEIWHLHQFGSGDVRTPYEVAYTVHTVEISGDVKFSKLPKMLL